MKLLLGSSNPDLGRKIASKLDCEIIDANITKFADGECRIEINDEVSPHEDIFIVQTTNGDEYIIEFLLMVDALKRKGARNIHGVIPYFSYSRQDKRIHPGSPLGAKVIADIIGRDILSLTTVDAHFAQLEGFFDIPVYNLLPYDAFASYIEVNSLHKNAVIVSPDVGGLKKTKEFSKKLGLETIIINKHRPKVGSSEITDVIGNAAGKNCIILDDMICGGGTVINAAKKLREMGALSVYVFATHGIFSSKPGDGAIDKIIITDTIERDTKCDKIDYISIAEIIAHKLDD